MSTARAIAATLLRLLDAPHGISRRRGTRRRRWSSRRPAAGSGEEAAAHLGMAVRARVGVRRCRAAREGAAGQQVLLPEISRQRRRV